MWSCTHAQASQAEIRIVAPSIAASDPDISALDVVNDPLGGGFSSHLLDELRVNLGIAYDVTSTLDAYRHGGQLSLSTNTTVENARVAVDVMLKSFADYRAVGPTREEVEGAKAFLIVDNARLFELKGILVQGNNRWPQQDLLGQPWHGQFARYRH